MSIADSSTTNPMENAMYEFRFDFDSILVMTDWPTYVAPNPSMAPAIA